ncbi:MAG TPA: hypothetical protein VHA52_05020 [Candidatus Babeliaceae bacterium]|nr:hypothetical protein [Candidatus Babeliaceae bacterium]
MKLLCIIKVAVASFFIQIQGSLNITQQYTIERVFGTTGVNVAPGDLVVIKELQQALHDSSVIDKYKAALFIQRAIAQKETRASKILERKSQQSQPLPIPLVLQHLILKLQREQLEKIVRGLLPEVSAFNRLRVWLDQRLNASIFHKHNNLIVLLENYYDLVRNVILYNYPKALAFFAAQAKHQLSDWLSLSEQPQQRALILQYIELATPIVKTQFFETIVELALQMSVFSGQQLAIQLFSEKDQEVYKAIEDRLKELEQGFQKFQTTVNDDTKEFAKQLYQKFSEQQKDIQKNTNIVQDRLNQEIIYLNQSISLDRPRMNYLAPFSQRVMYDRLFAVARMNNSDTNPWYNIYQGSWLYNHQKNSFTQHSIVPLQAQSAQQNNIFTEYIPSEIPYTIEVDITLVSVTYPFFAGLQFNQARWIAGSIERMQSFRALGIYGQREGGQNSIELRFGQSSITVAEGKITSKSGLDNIINNNDPTVLFKLPVQIVESLGKDPLTFRLTVKNDMLAVTVTLNKVADTVEQLFTQTVTSLDAQQSKALFFYHGIGFFSPGCQASFNLRQPSLMPGRS